MIRIQITITVQKYHLVKIYQIFFQNEICVRVIAFHSFETVQGINTLLISYLKPEYCNLPVLNA